MDYKDENEAQEHGKNVAIDQVTGTANELAEPVETSKLANAEESRVPQEQHIAAVTKDLQNQENMNSESTTAAIPPVIQLVQQAESEETHNEENAKQEVQCEENASMEQEAQSEENASMEQETQSEKCSAVEVIEEVRQDLEENTELSNIMTVNTLNIESNVLLTTPASTTEACIVQPVAKIAQTSLSLLAQYDSDADSDSGNEHSNSISDDDSVVEVAITDNKEYRNKVVEIHSDTDDASDSSSSSDNEDEASQKEYLAKMRKVIEKRMELSDDDDDDEDDDENAGKRKKRQPPKVRGEMLLDDLPPIQDLQITVPEDECIELGRIHSIVDQLVLVSVLPNSVLLDLDTVLFLDKGKRVLGEVFDVLGQVADPLYCIRFNTHEQIVDEKSLKVGDIVYVAPKTQYTQFVILSSLMKLRGSDASWENDIEPPPRYVDYSDDEQERAARGRLRNKDRSCERDGHATKIPRTDSQECIVIESSSSNNDTERVYRNYNGRGGRGTRGGRGFGPPRGHSHPRHYNAGDDFNAGSWHSNYYHGPAPAAQYRMPPPPSPANYNHPMYAPMPQFNSYPQMPPQHIAPQPQPPMFVLNPYAIRPPILPPTQHMPHPYSMPPPAPGSQ